MFNPWPPAPPQPPLHGWRDASGRWHWFSIYPLGNAPSWIGQCVYIFARPRHDPAQFRDPLYIGEKGDTDRFENHEKLKPALMLGGTELHVHFTSGSRWERLDIETDLRNEHWTPLNAQPTRAEPVNALGGLAPFGLSPPGGILGALGYGSPAPAAPSHAGGIAGFASALQPRNALLDAFEPPNSLSALVRTLGISR